MITKILDITISTIILFVLSLYALVRIAFKNDLRWSKEKRLLVLDMAYTLEAIRNRNLTESIKCRDLNGYFNHVWSVHPMATVILPEDKSETYGKPISTLIAERHTIIEGKIGRSVIFKKFPIINFILSQWSVCSYLNHLIKKEHISVIRAGDPYYLGLLGLYLAKSHNLPLVIRISGNYDEIYKSTGKPLMPRLFRKRWIEKIIERISLRSADLVAAPNQDNLNYALSNGAREGYSTIFRYGNLVHWAHRIPPDERPAVNNIMSSLGLSGYQFVLCIGRLEPIKMPDHVILSVAELKKRGYDIKTLFIGDGSMKDNLIKIVADLNIKDKIVFVGNKDQQWIASVLPHATAILSPITGRALTEAALAGVPIVAYDIDWQSELIKTGETGELVEFKNWYAMADAVERFLKDPIYAKAMGENVRKAAMEMMDPVKLNEHEKNEYDKLFARFYCNKSQF